MPKHHLGIVNPNCIVEHHRMQQQPFSSDHQLFFKQIQYIDFTNETWFLIEWHYSCAIKRVKQHFLTSFRYSKPNWTVNITECNSNHFHEHQFFFMKIQYIDFITETWFLNWMRLFLSTNRIKQLVIISLRYSEYILIVKLLRMEQQTIL